MKRIIINITDTAYGTESLRENTLTVADIINELNQYDGDLPVYAVMPNWAGWTYCSLDIDEDCQEEEEEDEDDDWED